VGVCSGHRHPQVALEPSPVSPASKKPKGCGQILLCDISDISDMTAVNVQWKKKKLCKDKAFQEGCNYIVEILGSRWCNYGVGNGWMFLS
jgi:hypothetical protein